MKKVLFLTTRLIYPVNDGRKVVLYNYCKGLVEQHNCEVRLFSILDDNEKVEQPNFISKVYYSKAPSNYNKIKNIIIKSLLQNKWPIQVSVYYSKKIKSYLTDVINEFEPDIVICDMARTAEYFKDLDEEKYNKILDMDDILSKRYNRQAESGIISINSIGAYLNRIPSFLKKIAQSNLVMKFIINKEAKLLNRYEIDISNYYKSIIFVSPVEAKEFNKKINSNKSIDITIGVDCEYFSKKVANEKKKNFIVFLGNMYVGHNKDSVKYFLDNVFPKILKDIPNCTLRIVGKCSDDYKIYLENYYKNIEVTGEVEDIRKYIQECAVSVAPLKYGTGIKTKILEVMAMGVPVITNDIGNEGIDLKDNVEAIIENDDEKLYERIVELLKNEDLQDTLSLNAKNFIYENYRWKNILKKFEKVI